MKTKICHMTSVHPADDVRIFHKQCVSLVEHGYEVHLVAKGPKLSDCKGVIHHPLPTNAKEGRFRRMIFRSWRTYRLAKQTNAALFHFHDPELLPYGLLLKWQGKRVIYDAHEDLPRDILFKNWIPTPFRKSVSWVIEKIEHGIARSLSATITATPFISERFISIGANSIDIKNYPKMAEFNNFSNECSLSKKHNTVCYVGTISEKRGIVEMIKAVEQLNIRLVLAGPFINHQTEALTRSLSGWKNVDYRGIVSRQEIVEIFSESILGLCVLHPTSTHIESLPIKLFEYMAAGLPVLASNIASWMKIMTFSQCGITVDPLNITEIANGITWFVQNDKKANAMGLAGRKAVNEYYSWEAEAERLVDRYQQIIVA